MTSDVIATGRKYRFATGGKLILFKDILLSSIIVNNKVIVMENRQKIFQLQLSQNRVINSNFVNYNYIIFPSLLPGSNLRLGFDKTFDVAFTKKIEIQQYFETLFLTLRNGGVGHNGQLFLPG